MEQIYKIPLDKIDDPRIAMRSDTKEEDIDELKRDLQAVGLLQPVVLRRVGDRYEIIAGHRRTCAARELGWPTIDAKVVDVDDDTAFQMRTIENLSRRDVDPVDEACYVAEIMQRTNKSVEDMAKIVHRSEAWVEQRLAIFQMPDYLQTQIKHKRISLGAALELDQITDEAVKKEYTNYAAQNGVSVGQAKQWRIIINAQKTWTPEAAAQVLGDTGNFKPERKIISCARCGGPCYLDLANTVFVHPTDCSPENRPELK